MKKTTSIILRVIAGVLGTAIVVFLALIAFSFLGNPITSFIAGQKIQTHIDQHFSYLTVSQEKIFYNFKDGRYYIRVQDKNSRDTHFSVFYDPRTKTTGDTYAQNVLSGDNTIMRFENEYSLLLQSLLQNALAQEESEYQLVSIHVMDSWRQDRTDIPDLDTPFDKGQVKDARVMITLSVPDFPGDPIQVAQQMQSLYQAMKNNGDHFIEYTLYLEYEDEEKQEIPHISGITGMTAQDIECTDFPQRAQELVEKSIQEMPNVFYHYADFAPEGSYPEKTMSIE